MPGCSPRPARTRRLRGILGCANAWLVLCMLAFCGCHQDSAEAAPATAQNPPNAMKPRYQDYLQVKHKARAWFDNLEVDSVELLAHGIKGKKKVAEILGVYMTYLNHTEDPQETAQITDRAPSRA